jgi:hypothetical protein
MTFTFDELKSLRNEGYTDDQIASVLAEDDSSIGDVFKEGFTLEQITSTISGQPIPEGFATQPAAPATFAEGAEDIGRKFLMGGVGGIRSITNILGASNPLSKSLAGVEDYIAEGLSAESQGNSRAISELFQKVEEKGLWDKFQAGLEAFKMAPGETLAQTAGYMIPNLVAGLAGKAAQFGRAGLTAVQAGVGATMGAGIVKGEIYEGTYEYLKQSGLSEEEARKRADEAQASLGKNLDQIFLAAGLGAVASTTGAEKIITRMLSRTGKEVSERSIKEVLKAGLGGAAGEAVFETIQEGQEKVASNKALQREGADVDTFAGVPQVMGMAAPAAAILGGGAGAISVLSTPEQTAERRIERDSNQAARELSVPAGDTTGQIIVNDIGQKENEIANLKEALQEQDINSPQGQELLLAIRYAETQLNALKKQAGETVESEQARLAREIAAPPAAPTAEATVTPAPVSETITEPAAAQPAAPAETPAALITKEQATAAVDLTERFNKALEQTKEFAPKAEPTLQNTRSVPDMVAKKGNRHAVSGGLEETNILDPARSKKRFDAIGYERQELQIPEDMNDRVSERYGPAIANVKSLASPSWQGVHFHGGLAISSSVKGTQRGRVLAHELGHASHSLLGDQINNNPEVLAELSAIEQLLYPGLREKISTASNADTRFFNYLLSADELIAEFNAERIINPEIAAQTAPTLNSLLESVEGDKNLVADRKSFPLFLGSVTETKSRLKVKGLEARKVGPETQDISTTKKLRLMVDAAKRNSTMASTWMEQLKNDGVSAATIKKAVDIAAKPELDAKFNELFPSPQPAAPAAEPAGIADTRLNPLGYDIADVVEDVKAGKTDTPLRAINQVVDQANELRGRVRAESERRQQPRKRGKAAILERIARERSSGRLSENTAQALTDFVNRIREDAIGDTAISIREKGVSNYDFADNLVTFFLSQDKGDLGTAVSVHEFWHGLSRFLPDAEVNQINQDYVRELEAYIKKNPWFLAFVGRYSLTPEQFEAYKKFNSTEAETKLEPQYDDQGNITKYKIKFDKDNYRYIMLDEFIAEKMTDLVVGKQAIPDTFLGKLAKAFRDFLDLIKARFGKNPYEKFYQLVTDENQKMRLQRESGVAPPIQIYEPQEYDYSTRRMMAVEPSSQEEAGPAPESPEGQSVPAALANGIDIGPENNMPPARKIESHLKNFLFLRGFFQSASDRLRRNGFVKLGNAIDTYFDEGRRRIGDANKIMLAPLEAYEAAPAARRKKIEEDFQTFYAAQENGRDTDAIREEMDPIAVKIVDAWQKFGEMSGKENQRVGVKVYDPSKGTWRKIGRVEKFWPRRLKPEYQRALMDPDKYAKEYNEIVEALLESGQIKDPVEAEKYLREYSPEATKNDYFSGIEKARGKPLPEKLYDYSMPVMTDYISRWAHHVSRIEQFGQKTTEDSKTLWDREMETTRDPRTRDYIQAARERVEGYFPNDPFLKGTSALNIWATGLQLGNPASAVLNLIGGSTLNAMIGQPGALGSYVASFAELRNLGQQMRDAKEKGVLGRDLMNIVGDHQAILETNGFAKAGQKTADFLLKWAGFTPAEQMIRTQSLIIGKSFVRNALNSFKTDPNGQFARRSQAWLSRNGFDIDKLIVEEGVGQETDRVLRYFSNIAQGSYTIDQVPIFIDMPVGRFLFKYQKFSTQVMRMSWKNTFEPLFKAMTGKGETIQIPDKVRQDIYRLKVAEARELGDTRKIDLANIPKTATKGQARALALIPAMMWLGSAYVGGEILLRMRDILFGVLMKGPDYEDMIKALEDDERAAALYLASERAWYNLIGIGALGLIGNYAQFFMDWQDRERVKNPLDPPALSMGKDTWRFIETIVDQGTVTAGDIDNYTRSTVSAYRSTKKLAESAAGFLGLEDIPGIKEEMFRREVASINKYARRWAADSGIEYRLRRPTEITATPRTPVNRKITAYLQTSQPQVAAAYAKAYLNTLDKQDRKAAIQSLTSSARNRQPLRLGTGPMDESERKAFLRWLKGKVSAEKYEKVAELDKQYQRDYKKFLRMLPNR